MIKCTKCGGFKQESEFYRQKRGTCKECLKAAQRERWAKKREVIKRAKWDAIRGYVMGIYGEADVQIDGVRVVVGGEFVGKRGKMMFCEMMLKHRGWMKKNKLNKPDMVPVGARKGLERDDYLYGEV